MNDEPKKTPRERARDIMLYHCFQDQRGNPPGTTGTWVCASFKQLEFEIIEAIEAAIRQERDDQAYPQR